jgi:hypothetical protein
MIRVTTIAALALAAGGPSWMKLDAARQAAVSTGKPILVYSGFT